MSSIWIVSIVNEFEQWAFESREDAYKFCKNYILTEYKDSTSNEMQECLDELKESYNYSDNADFCVEDVFYVRDIPFFKKGEF
jgi:hypothetical protein